MPFRVAAPKELESTLCSVTLRKGNIFESNWLKTKIRIALMPLLLLPNAQCSLFEDVTTLGSASSDVLWFLEESNVHNL